MIEEWKDRKGRKKMKNEGRDRKQKEGRKKEKNCC